MERKKIEKRAEEFVCGMFTDSGYVDVIQIAQAHGFVVGNAQFENGDDGFIAVDESRESIQDFGTNKLIAVNANRDLAAKRFIIAHEIGHYALHYDANVKQLFVARENKKNKVSEEQDVDFFAACLLMPKKEFKEKVKEFKRKGFISSKLIFALSDYFSAPLESVMRRMGEIGINNYA